VVVNNLNIPKPPEGQPALLTFDEVTTAFHEFGHALHGLFASQEYPLISGTAVPPDFVEFPSQYNEMWASFPEVFAHYAKHYQTGAPMPEALAKRVLAATKFGQGFATLEYLEAAMYDQNWHQLSPGHTPDAKHAAAFELAALKKDGVYFPAVPPRYHTPYFLHIWANGYEAAYYAYIWSGVLAADTAAWMRSHGGLERANGDFLRAKVLSRGYTEEPGKLFQAFYGRGPEIGPLLESRGLTLPQAKAKK
jgi:peptidyl-dipeptidase Dcp